MATLEERVAALESEVVRLKKLFIPAEETEQEVQDDVPLSLEEILEQIERIRQEYPPTPQPEPTAPEFLDRFTGIFADDPAFSEVARYSEEKRKRERQAVNRDR